MPARTKKGHVENMFQQNTIIYFIKFGKRLLNVSVAPLLSGVVGHRRPSTMKHEGRSKRQLLRPNKTRKKNVLFLQSQNMKLNGWFFMLLEDRYGERPARVDAKDFLSSSGFLK